MTCGGVVLAGLLVWISWSVYRFNSGSDRGLAESVQGVDQPRNAGGWKVVDLPIMLVADYYEHGIEHAPPRDPSGCMQRRERYYQAPPNPYVVVPALLTHSEADERLREWVEHRRTAFLSGQPFSEAESKQVEQLASESSLKAEILLDIGRGFAFMEGDELAACCYRAGLAKAQRQYSGTAPGDPAARPLLHLMDQTKALWRLKDYEAMEKRFALAMRLNPALSVESRRAGYLHAEMLFYQNRVTYSADAMLAVQAMHEQVGDLGTLEQSDIQEMHWVLGVFLFHANRPAEAQPHLRAAASIDGPHKERATRCLVSVLASLGQVDQAERCYAIWCQRYGYPGDEPLRQLLLSEIAAGRNMASLERTRKSP